MKSCKNFFLGLALATLFAGCKDQGPVTFGSENVSSNSPSSVENEHAAEQEPVDINPYNFERVIKLEETRMVGLDIMRLQERLKELGYYLTGRLDGEYGPMSERYIKQLQGLMETTQTGVVDRYLWDTIFDTANTSWLRWKSRISRFNFVGHWYTNDNGAFIPSGEDLHIYADGRFRSLSRGLAPSIYGEWSIDEENDRLLFFDGNRTLLFGGYGSDGKIDWERTGEDRLTMGKVFYFRMD